MGPSTEPRETREAIIGKTLSMFRRNSVYYLIL